MIEHGTDESARANTDRQEGDGEKQNNNRTERQEETGRQEDGEERKNRLKRTGE
jgi:hypothetical protein